MTVKGRGAEGQRATHGLVVLGELLEWRTDVSDVRSTEDTIKVDI